MYGKDEEGGVDMELTHTGALYQVNQTSIWRPGRVTVTYVFLSINVNIKCSRVVTVVMALKLHVTCKHSARFA
jgi:hypothetical protein